MVVFDTAALLFWSFNRHKLTCAAANAIADARRLLISSISIWEIGLKVERQKLNIPITPREMVERLRQIDQLEIIPIDEEIWLQSVELDWSHRDPADRVIVAMAKRNAAKLITSDMEMRRYYQNSVW